MVPVLDMANHATDANAYYEKSKNGDIVLLLRPDEKVEAGKEITISYGSSKSAAEMVFSYGFIDEKIQSQSLVLGLHQFPNDPLSKAKLAAFSDAPIVRISLEADVVTWSSPFLFLICLNEEDGLEFRVLQEVDDSQGQLQVLWQGNNVTESTDRFEDHISQHPMKDVFTLRAVALLQDRIQQQLERLYAGAEISAAFEASMIELDKAAWTAALKLRILEKALLELACDTLESQVSVEYARDEGRNTTTELTANQKSSLMGSPAVLAYLGMMNRTVDNEVSDEDKRKNDDFS